MERYECHHMIGVLQVLGETAGAVMSTARAVFASPIQEHIHTEFIGASARQEGIASTGRANRRHAAGRRKQ